MFKAESFEDVDITTGVVPSVSLLWMTPDPLGAIASMAAMYEGRVIREMNYDLTDADRQRYFQDVCSTHLDTPLEAVKFQFLFEGVDRATTHQVVRARHQTYAQESLRFAVVDDLSGGTSLPHSLWGTDHTQPLDGSPEMQAASEMRGLWDGALSAVSKAYAELIARGMPAEEARGLLPHATATRMQVVTDLRTLKAEAGNRLCTQAQFHWRILWIKILEAIRQYRPDGDFYGAGREENAWQYDMLASSEIFRPVCYQIGKCPFKASFDRACSIRSRVEIRSKNGSHDSREWHKPLIYNDPSGEGYLTSDGIQTSEWLADPSAARRS